MANRHEVLHKIIVERLYPQYGSNSATSGTASKLARMVDAVKALEDVSKSADPYETPAAHLKKVSEMSKRLQSRVKAAKAEATEALEAERARYQDRIREKANLRPTENAAEIRAVLRGMKKQERHDVLQKAMDNGDTDILSAVASGSELLTGIEDQLRTAFVDHYARKVAPEYFHEIEQIDGLSEHLPMVFEQFELAANDAGDPQLLADNDAMAAKAKEAEDALNIAFTNAN